MQDDRLRDFLKFFKSHLAWFILSAGFFGIILVSGLLLSTEYLFDATSQNEAVMATPSLEPISLATDSASIPVPPTTITPPSPSATLEPTSAPGVLSKDVPTISPSIVQAPTQTPSEAPASPTTPSPDRLIQPGSSTDETEYIVQMGDSLWKIAESKYQDGRLYSRISQVNSLENPDLLAVGQKLKLLPLSEVEKAGFSQQPTGSITDTAWSDDKTEYHYYDIATGDSLWKIAERELGNPYRWVELYQLNKTVIGPNPDLIFPGDTVRIPMDTKPVSTLQQPFNWTSSLLQ